MKLLVFSVALLVVPAFHPTAVQYEERDESRVYRLDKLQAVKLAEALKPIIKGKIVSDPNTNSIVVTGKPRVHRAVSALLRLDASEGERPSVRVYPFKYLQLREGKEVAGTLSDLGIAAPYDAASNCILVEGTAQEHKAVARLISLVDKPVHPDFK